MANVIEVSVLCLAYNHKKYIKQALDSIITQKTHFSFEVVVHDDNSTDGTTEIIKQYAKSYPDLIHPIYECENQFSKGKDIFIDLSLPHIKGKYIAFCECDDYWTDDSKLQRQYDIMEAHPELDMCACRAMEISGLNGLELQEIRPKKEDSILTVEEVILEGGRYLATASLFFRKNIFDMQMGFEKILCFDYTHQIKGALRGGIYYLDRKMAAYRKGVEGSWTMRVERDKEKRDQHKKEEIKMLHELDRETQIYHTVIEQRLTAYTPFYDHLMMHIAEIKAEICSLSKDDHTLYLWGLGMRGDAFQEFCKHEDIGLNGVCDIQNICVGKVTQYGYQIYESDFVFHNSDIIFASNDNIYNALAENEYSGYLINLQKYMPLS